MSMFRHSRREVPGLNTASLPDLIFTVLFFFMIVTHMRKVTLKVRYQVPQGTELTRLTKKGVNTYIYIGEPSADMRSAAGDGIRIQMNDKYISPAEVEDYVAAERSTMNPEDTKQQVVVVRADRNTPMGVITDVKQALRRAGALRINYAATETKQ